MSHGQFWLNQHLLLWISFIPFPTALIGDYFTNRLALAVFGSCLGLTTGAFPLIRFYGLRHPELLAEGADRAEYRRGTWRSVDFGVPPYLLGALLGWAWPPAALLLYVALLREPRRHPNCLGAGGFFNKIPYLLRATRSLPG